jgi:hypothetical protein
VRSADSPVYEPRMRLDDPYGPVDCFLSGRRIPNRYAAGVFHCSEGLLPTLFFYGAAATGLSGPQIHRRYLETVDRIFKREGNPLMRT